MKRKLSDSVVVITGASSGIGRAAAHRFARKGATVVLASRQEPALKDVAQECEQIGGRALVVPTDVTDESAVQRLARQAIENFGRIDVWVNNAAVTLFGRFEESPPEVYRRVLETNLFGYIHGARAVFPYFREQGQGTLIDVASVVSKMPQPYTSAYVSSKYAILGLGKCLRMELSLNGAPNIHVCTVLPASIDTPLFQNGANYFGRKARAMSPVYSADKVARAIVKLARSPEREVMVGSAGRIAAFINTIAPAFFERVGARQIAQNHFQDVPESPTPGNLFEPKPEHAAISGGWQSESGQTGVGTFVLAGLAIAVPALLAWTQRRRLFPQWYQRPVRRAFTRAGQFVFRS